MTRSTIAAAAMMLIVASRSLAQDAATAPPPASAQPAATPEAPVRSFLSELLAGRTVQAVDGLLAASTNVGQKPGERDNLLAQLDASIQAYGPVIGFERSGAQAAGSMSVRHYYMVQHRDMVVRWEFILVRTGAGWRVDYFGFDDQPRTWF